MTTTTNKTRARQETLRELIDTVRNRYVTSAGTPVPMADVAVWCGVSRQHLYLLCDGRNMPREDTMRALATGLEVPEKRVRAAIEETQRRTKR